MTDHLGAREEGGKPLLPEQIAELRALDEKASPGPWAYEGVSEKANDYRVGIVCPVDAKGDVGPAIAGNVRHHPHFFNAETNEFGDWYCEEIAMLDEVAHTSEGGTGSDAALIVALRNSLPQLLSAAERGIAAGEEVETLKEVIRRTSARHLEREGALLKAEADLAASNARIGELERELRMRRQSSEQNALMDEMEALLTPTHPETER